MAQDNDQDTDPDTNPFISLQDKARILSEALPFMQRYDNETVVVKYGGHAMGDAALSEKFARDIVQLKQTGINPIVVHGGGPQIGAMLERLEIKSSFADGLRITDRQTVEIVEMVLSGSINKQVVSAIHQAGGRAVGISGKDGNLIVAKKMARTKRDPDSNIEQLIDLGFVGEPAQINPEILATMVASDIIPVIAPIGVSTRGETYNINADTAAGAIAQAVDAKRLLMLTDVEGVLDKQGALIRELSAQDARILVDDGTISGGMIPKLQTAISTVEAGVEGVIILDGRVPHIVLLELFQELGQGTRVS